MRVFALALNIALVIVVVAWLHNPPWGYRKAPHDQSNAVDAQERAQGDKNRADKSAPIFPLNGSKKAENKAYSASDNPQQGPSEWGNSDLIAVAVGVVALLQFLALVATWWLMVRTARRQLRAYVFADKTEVQNLDGPDPISANVTIKNFGQTPAYRLTAWGGIGLRPFPSSDFPNPPSERTRQTMVPPGGAFTRIEVGRPLDEEQRTLLREGTAAIYVYGDIQYVDAFNRPQWCKYRLMFGGDAGVHISINEKGMRVGILSVCADGNDASEG